jgi:hypothetical protein
MESGPLNYSHPQTSPPHMLFLFRQHMVFPYTAEKCLRRSPAALLVSLTVVRTSFTANQIGMQPATPSLHATSCSHAYYQNLAISSLY